MESEHVDFSGHQTFILCQAISCRLLTATFQFVSPCFPPFCDTLVDCRPVWKHVSAKTHRCHNLEEMALAPLCRLHIQNSISLKLLPKWCASVCECEWERCIPHPMPTLTWVMKVEAVYESCQWEHQRKNNWQAVFKILFKITRVFAFANPLFLGWFKRNIGYSLLLLLLLLLFWMPSLCMVVYRGREVGRVHTPRRLWCKIWQREPGEGEK